MKHLLCAYRVLLSGIHFMRSGEQPTSLGALEDFVVRLRLDVR